MIIIAHRGAPHEALENSWASFEKAIEAGAHRIEFDVHMTKAEPVVIHDETLDRTCTQKGPVAELSAAAQGAVRLKNGEPLPTLAQLIPKLLNHLEVNIELKGGGELLLEQVIARLPPMEERSRQVILSSFDPELIRLLYRRYPGERRALLWDRQDTAAIPSVMADTHCTMLHPEFKLLDETLINTCRDHAWQVFPFIDQTDETEPEEVWRKLKNWNIDGFCTNYPRELARWLRTHSD